jgi:hypothetical protein
VSTLAPKDPFAALIAQAAAAPAPKVVGRYEKRLASAGTDQIVLADVSSSMVEAAGARTKIEVLREALATVPPARLIAFASTPIEIASPAALPAPSGGTALHLALDLAATMRPARSLVVSDGEPDSEDAALEASERVPGVIDVLYCGPDSNRRAVAFLRRLARAGCGRYAGHDLRVAPLALAPALRALLLTAGGRS